MSNYVEVELGGKNRKIKYGYNAIADLEVKAGMSLNSIVSDEQMGFNSIRLLLWAGLKGEDRGLTLDRVGMFIEGYMEDGGDLAEIAKLCIEALQKTKMFGNLKAEGNGMTETAN